MIAGLLTFLDPPKEAAGPAIAALRENGVAVKVLTGDNPVVSAKICREVGLDVGEPLLGRDIDLMDDATLQRLAEERTVFAKLTPLQKSRVLKALQGNGHTVGFLGDGINDAPRCEMPMSASRWTAAPTSPRNRPTSSSWKKA